MADHILYNFYEAESLTINAAMFGSILAPGAAIEAPWGLIEGQVIANSWSGNAQVNDAAFTPPALEVPEPGNLSLFLLGALGLLASRRSNG
jgi:hypothetical protein